jgi:hypothetical protein
MGRTLRKVRDECTSRELDTREGKQTLMKMLLKRIEIARFKADVESQRMKGMWDPDL